jgi:hypothetical protein
MDGILFRTKAKPWFNGPMKGEETTWGVATGALDSLDAHVWFRHHIHVADTKDGGAASWP